MQNEDQAKWEAENFLLNQKIAQVRTMPKWEYKAVVYETKMMGINGEPCVFRINKHHNIHPQGLSQFLSIQGDEGWELVSFEDGLYIFKRPQTITWERDTEVIIEKKS